MAPAEALPRPLWRRVLPEVFRAGLALAWTCVGVLVLFGSVSDHPLRAPAGLRRGLLLIAPQGWGFFTRDPREPVDRVYRHTPGGWEEITHANSSPRNALGLSRGARAVGVELTAVLGRVPAERWRDCRAPAGDCWPAAAPGGAPVRNPALRPRLCGDILVERRPPVPWAWSRSRSDLAMPARVVRVEVACIAAPAPLSP